MNQVVIVDKKCPFCHKTASKNKVLIPQFKKIPVLYCKKCKIFLFHNKYHEKIIIGANSLGRRLNNSVYFYTEAIISTSKQKEEINMKKKKKPFRPSSPGRLEIETTSRKVYKDELLYQPEKCPNRRLNSTQCKILDDVCNPNSFKCINRRRKISNTQNKMQVQTSTSVSVSSPKPIQYKTLRQVDGVTAIVLTNNRKCTNDKHELIDMKGTCKVAKPNGAVIDIVFPAAYCKTCDKYFVLKRDFAEMKQHGSLLCLVEDYTKKYTTGNVTMWGNNESIIHMLGYNVSKVYNYTYAQRCTILANILENTKITAQEIMSIIDISIARHKNQWNYSDAVKKWKEDRRFVEQYKIGDKPEVRIGKIIIGKR